MKKIYNIIDHLVKYSYIILNLIRRYILLSLVFSIIGMQIKQEDKQSLHRVITYLKCSSDYEFEIVL